MSWPAYADYRDTGIDWLGLTPSSWSIERMSWLFNDISSGTTPESANRDFYDGDINWVTTGELREKGISQTGKRVTLKALSTYSALKVYPAGTLLIAMYGATIGRLGWLDAPACTNQACCAFANPKKVSTRFAFYALSAARDHLILLASGGGQPNINQDKLRSLRIAVPSVREQAAIAKFLDAETAKIDALIAKQEQLIATLREDRTAIITHAVTHGLKPSVEMVDAGVWLGNIPRHWTRARLRDIITSIESGVSVNGAEVPADLGEVGVLKTSCVTGGEGVFRPEANKTVHLEEINRVSCPVRAGTLIVNRANTADLVGSVGYVSEDVPNLYLSDLLWAVSVRGVEPRFLHLWMQTPVYRTQIAAWRSGFNLSMQKLAKSSLRTFVAALPPTCEQRDIVAFVSRSTAKIDGLIVKANEVIDTLREYRSALITDAVTGKIDVRGAA